MITRKHLLALLGFLFVASWIAFGLGYAILCLAGAAVFYAGGALLDGELDLAGFQARVQRDPARPR